MKDKLVRRLMPAVLVVLRRTGQRRPSRTGKDAPLSEQALHVSSHGIGVCEGEWCSILHIPYGGVYLFDDCIKTGIFGSSRQVFMSLSNP